LWLILEEVDGPHLNELLGQSLSWQAIAAIGLDLTRALLHAHRAGETHGQLYVGSIQLTKSGRTKLAGFGQRPRPDGDEVEALEPQTRGGLSPEASIGQTVGPLSDLFAWGCLLYELLSGQAPFGDPNDTSYAARVRNDRPKPLLLLRPDLPSGLEHIIGRCLEKLPSERPAHAAEIAEALETLIGGATMPILRNELSRLGFSVIGADEGRAAVASSSRERSPLSGALRLYGLSIGAAIASAAIAGTVVYAGTRVKTKKPEEHTLEANSLPTDEALLLRVVASPWAHVLVDGQHRETTPFAQPIQLTPGKHIVRLEHPFAAAEERVVEGTPGQAVLLNVQMHVERPLELNAPETPVEENSP
jgi:serine/threonine protein kinase